MWETMDAGKVDTDTLEVFKLLSEEYPLVCMLKEVHGNVAAIGVVKEELENTDELPLVTENGAGRL